MSIDVKNYPNFDTDFLIEVSKGNVEGHSLVQKFGSAESINSNLTVISSAKTYQTPTTLTALDIFSDDANDTTGGTGAIDVEVFGLGAGWNPISEVVTLNGTTAVTLVNTYFRMSRMKVKTSGTYSNPTQSSHTSTITLSLSGAPTTLWGIMNSEGTFGLGQSEIGAYTTPTGYYGFVLSKNIGFEASKNASVFMFVRENADTVIAPFGAMRSIELDRNINNRIDVVPKGVLAVLPPITDVGFMAKSITGTTALSVDFEILLVREDLVNI
jgi:hypothetical protein